MIKFIHILLVIIAFAGGTLPAEVRAAASDGGWNLKFVMNSDNEGKKALYPSSLFVDEAGEKYYLVDTGNNRLLSFSRDGKPLHAFNAGGGLSKPVSMAKDGSGSLLVIEKGKGGLTKIDVANKSIETKAVQYEGAVLHPKKVRFLNGLTYILDTSRGAVTAFTEEGSAVGRYTCPKCGYGFTDFQVTGSGILALAGGEGEIILFGLDGNINSKIVLQPKPEFPVSFALNKSGDIFVLERHAGKVSVYDSAGLFQYSLFSKGEKEGHLYYPTEVQFDPWGGLCVVEEGNGRLSVFRQ